MRSLPSMAVTSSTVTPTSGVQSRSEKSCHYQDIDTFANRKAIKMPSISFLKDPQLSAENVVIVEQLEGPYRGVFKHKVTLCPTKCQNNTRTPGYSATPTSSTFTAPEFWREQLHDYLRVFYQIFQGEPMLNITDDCSATKSLTNKKYVISELIFFGQHGQKSVLALTQKFNSVLKDLREQTRLVAHFHCCERDSEDCLRENDVTSITEERAALRGKKNKRTFC